MTSWHRTQLIDQLFTSKTDRSRSRAKKVKRLYYDSTVRLIAWLNYKKLADGGCGATGNYIVDIIKALPAFPVIVDDLMGVTIRVMSQAVRSEAIFAPYTYNVFQTQYLMLPYDFFSLEIRTSFYIIAECVNDTSGCLEC